MKWHRVELHVHTIASDGSMSPEVLVDRAKDREYDAIVVTDHNTTSLCEEVAQYGKEKKLLVVPGIEWTTFWGHILVIGGNSKIDWRDITIENIEECILKAKKQGDVVIVAHPNRLGTPFASECKFLFDIKDWSNILGLEVWSHYNPNTGEDAYRTKMQWLDLLRQGYKLVPFYGYDWHTSDRFSASLYAFTYIGVEGALTKESFMAALKNRNVYISMGAEIECVLYNDKKEYNPGDEIKPGDYVLKIKSTFDKDYKEKFKCEMKNVKIYYKDELFMARKFDGEGEIEIPLSLKEKAVLGVEFYGRVNDKDGDVAILSPFYIK